MSIVAATEMERTVGAICPRFSESLPDAVRHSCPPLHVIDVVNGRRAQPAGTPQRSTSDPHVDLAAMLVGARFERRLLEEPHVIVIHDPAGRATIHGPLADPITASIWAERLRVELADADLGISVQVWVVPIHSILQ